MTLTMHWIFGGTAVGKKHFIRQAVAGDLAFLVLPSQVGKVWHEDGNKTPQGLVENCRRYNAVFVRWQWGRELVLESILVQSPKVNHIIYLLEAQIATQSRRALVREGDCVFERDSLIGEAMQVRELVEELVEEFQLPAICIDTSFDNQHQLIRRSI